MAAIRNSQAGLALSFPFNLLNRADIESLLVPPGPAY
jgi:hypothetical protein